MTAKQAATQGGLATVNGAGEATAAQTAGRPATTAPSPSSSPDAPRRDESSPAAAGSAEAMPQDRQASAKEEALATASPSTDLRHPSSDLRHPSTDLRPLTSGLTAFETEVVGIFVDLMSALALPKSLGEIYGLLYASTTPLGFATIQSRLGLSKGSVSQGLRALREIGVIRTAGTDEAGRETVEAELEMRKLLLACLSGRLQPQLQASAARVDRLEALLAATEVTGPDRQALEQRVGKLAKWRKRASGLLPWIEKFLA